MNIKKFVMPVLLSLSMLMSMMPISFAENADADDVAIVTEEEIEAIIPQSANNDPETASLMAQDAEVTITADKDTVDRGEEITYTVDVSNASLIGGVFVKLSFDDTVLEYDGIAKGELFGVSYIGDTAMLITPGSTPRVGALLYFDGNHDVTSSSSLFSVTFKVKESAAAGEYGDLLSVSECSVVDWTSESTFNTTDLAAPSIPALTVTEGTAAYPLTVTVDKTSVKMGDEVTYTISNNSVSNLTSLQLDLVYNSDVLSYVSGSMTDGLGNAAISSTALVFAQDTAVTGEIATMTFKVQSTGDTSITASAKSASAEIIAEFPTVSVTSDVKLVLSADKTAVSKGDSITYTLSAPSDITASALQFDIDFSGLNAKAAEDPTLGTSLSSDDLDYKGTSYNNGVFSVFTASSSDKVIKAGTLASVTLVVSSDLSAPFVPSVTKNIVNSNDTAFEGDISLASVSPDATDAVLKVTPKLTTVAAGDYVTYTVSLSEPITTAAFQFEITYDSSAIDGNVTGTELATINASQTSANINNDRAVITYIAADANDFTVPTDIYEFTFKTKSAYSGTFTPTVTKCIAENKALSTEVTPITIVSESTGTVEVVPSSKYAAPGEDVTYTLNMTKANALTGVVLNMKYDTSVYDLKSVDVQNVGSLTGSKNTATAGQVILYYTDNDNGSSYTSSTSAQMAVVTLTVKSDAASGSDGVTVTSEGTSAKNNVTVSAFTPITIAAAHGDLVLTIKEDSATLLEKFNVDINIENASNLLGVQFDIEYNPQEVGILTAYNKLYYSGTTMNVVEESGTSGKVTVVYAGSDIQGSVDFMDLVFYAKSLPGAYSSIKLTDVRTVGALDTVKASDSIYIFSQEEIDEINAVISAIDSIGDINKDNYLTKKAAAQTIRNAYNALSNLQKERVTNLSTLDAADAAIAQIEADLAAAENVDNLIRAIAAAATPTAKAQAIETARAAYDALNDMAKSYVTTLDTLTAAEADKAAADKVDAAIAAAATDAEVEAARAAYDALTDAQKAYVTKLADLEAAEKTIAEAKAAAAAVDEKIAAATTDADVEAARAAYNALSDKAKTYVTKLADLEAAEKTIADNKAAAAAVDEKIAAATTDADVEAARAAYDALTDTQKAYVTKLADLEAAEKKIADNKAAAAAVDEAIAAIGTVDLTKKDAIDAAKDAYDKLTDEQKAYVTKADDLTTAQKEYDALYEAMNPIAVTVTKTATGYNVSVDERKTVTGTYEVIFAVYDSTGRLLSATKVDKSAAKDVAVSDANAVTKVMVWDSVNGMVPATDYDVINA